LIQTGASAATPFISAGIAALGNGDPGSTQPMGESFLQSFGGPVGLGGDPMLPMPETDPAPPQIPPVAIAVGAAAILGILFVSMRRRK